MALDQRKYERKHTDVLRDIRPAYVRLGDWMAKPIHAAIVFWGGALAIYSYDMALLGADFIILFYVCYFLWLTARDRTLAFKLPFGARWRDKNNEGPGRSGKGEGILYLGNVKDTKEEAWFSNSDARTHILYLGTTGSGKTEGLKSMVTNALTWGSGFIYVDGKADTDLWSSLSSLLRRFGRDDDLLVLNYMTGNSDVRAPSNTMNPFSSGSASYLTNMLVSLMPDAEGDNAMWKERAVALVASLMPALTWKRDHQDIPMSVSTIRDYLNLNNVIKLSRDKAVPEEIRAGIKGYLDTLPGFVDNAFDDNGQEKPPGPDQPQYDTTTPRQQHGYLSMQFTRALQSLGDEYGYIFDTQAADVDMVDTVLNRRILIVLIPALEKSSDETANLGKIVAATLKGMMGSTLGSKVEGESSTVIENKPTNSSTPFMVVFDEVGYYTAQGMAVMAAQARSLGFCLVYSAQDLPAMEKRVKEEARSITANCNIKIFGKLEDPTQTKEFFEKTVGSAMVIEASGFQLSGGRGTGSYYDSLQASLQVRPRASYDGLRAFKEGEAVIAFGEMVVDTHIFYSNPGHAKAMRVTRYISLPPPDENTIKNASVLGKVRDLMVHKSWTAMKADVAAETPEEIVAMAEIIETVKSKKADFADTGKLAVVAVHALTNTIEPAEEAGSGTSGSTGGQKPSPIPTKPPAATPPPAQPARQTPPAQTPPATAKPAQPETQKAPPPPPGPAKPAETAAGSSDNPMAIFGKKKEDGVATPGAAAAPAAPTPPEQPPAENTPATPPSIPADTAKAKGPINWDDLVKEEGQQQGNGPAATSPSPATAGQSPATAPASSTLPRRKPLDPNAERILKDAGQKAREALFKKQKDSDVDAAE